MLSPIFLVVWVLAICVALTVAAGRHLLNEEEYQYSLAAGIAIGLLSAGILLYIAAPIGEDYVHAEIVSVSEDRVYFETEGSIVAYETDSPWQYPDTVPYLLLIEQDGTVSVVWRCAE